MEWCESLASAQLLMELIKDLYCLELSWVGGFFFFFFSQQVLLIHHPLPWGSGGSRSFAGGTLGFGALNVALHTLLC